MRLEIVRRGTVSQTNWDTLPLTGRHGFWEWVGPVPWCDRWCCIVVGARLKIAFFFLSHLLIFLLKLWLSFFCRSFIYCLLLSSSVNSCLRPWMNEGQEEGEKDEPSCSWLLCCNWTRPRFWKNAFYLGCSICQHRREPYSSDAHFFSSKMVLSLCLVWDLCCCNKCRPVLMTLTQNRDSQWMRITHIASRVKNIFNTFFLPTTLNQWINQQVWPLAEWAENTSLKSESLNNPTSTLHVCVLTVVCFLTRK